ncbi:MAG: methyltransferase domain-containing protein [Candidatus Omnitrophota bacterium]
MKETNPNGGEKRFYFDRLGDCFTEYMNEYDVQRRLVLIYEELLRGFPIKDKRILEVGCGAGHISRAAVERGADLCVLDIGCSLVKRVSATLNIDGAAGDACCLPFADNRFAAVISSECIEHTLDPEEAIREMVRVCAPGGIVCFTTPNRLWRPVLQLSVLLKIRKFAGIENWIWPNRAANLLQECGMESITFCGCHLWPFQLTFTQGLLRRIDAWGQRLYPVMISFGVTAVKPSLDKPLE